MAEQNRLSIERASGNSSLEYMEFPFAIEIVKGEGGDDQAAKSKGPSLHIRGLASVYDSPSELVEWGEFYNIIKPGAFTKTLNEDDQVMLWQHDVASPLARRATKTLRLADTAEGLAVDGDMAPTTVGKDAAISIERGDVQKMSFGFTVVREEWRYEAETDQMFRDLLAVKLFEVSPVTFPLFPATSIETYSHNGTTEAAKAARKRLIPIVFDMGADRSRRLALAQRKFNLSSIT